MQVELSVGLFISLQGQFTKRESTIQLCLHYFGVVYTEGGFVLIWLLQPNTAGH